MKPNAVKEWEILKELDSAFQTRYGFLRTIRKYNFKEVKDSLAVLHELVSLLEEYLASEDKQLLKANNYLGALWNAQTNPFITSLHIMDTFVCRPSDTEKTYKNFFNGCTFLSNKLKYDILTMEDYIRSVEDRIC
jgi:ribosomal protein L11 methylase PrmA